MNTPHHLASAFLFLVVALLCACDAPSDSDGDTAGAFAFVDVNVIPMDTDRVVEHQTVVIAEGRILSMGDTVSLKIPAGAQRIEASDAWITPTLTTSRNILAVFEDFDGELAMPEARYLHPMDLGIWSFIYTNLYKPIPDDHRAFIREGFFQLQRPLTRALGEAGAKMMTGTDALVPSTLPGFSIHDELAELVAAGLSPYEALRSSTTEPFAFLGELDQAGTIEVGKRSNLVLLQSNPLSDISATRAISGVMLQERWLEKEDLDQGLTELAAGYEAGR